jgi:hypothetical protein
LPNDLPFKYGKFVFIFKFVRKNHHQTEIVTAILKLNRNVFKTGLIKVSLRDLFLTGSECHSNLSNCPTVANGTQPKTEYCRLASDALRLKLSVTLNMGELRENYKHLKHNRFTSFQNIYLPHNPQVQISKKGKGKNGSEEVEK